ncbi:MAG: RNA-binding transcriptional accessory protein [Oscillospiraceae bacterium]|nr:RNA-binding transcriptional accessory protein [Oscillospiraceae bacterium]
MTILEQLTAEFHLQLWQVENAVQLMDEGNTIPFIARYRKEQHGTLDDQVLRGLSERLEYLRSLEKRREEVRASIEVQEKLTPEIEAALAKAVTLAEIEDIYRPYRPKRRTRASIAKEKGLEPLALRIYAQEADSAAPLVLAEAFVDGEKGVASAEEALQGAMDIIAEMISDNADIRRRLRNLCGVVGELKSQAAKPGEDSVYADYYDFKEGIKKIADHRVLAINRGEREAFLKASISLDPVRAHNVITSETLEPGGRSACTETVRAAGADAYDRLIFPSIEREIRGMLTERANASAIRNFAVNLRELLLQPPVKGKAALGLDPGYRTGCKVAAVDPTGLVLETGVIYVTHSAGQYAQAKQYILSLIAKYGVEIVAIGNGTASRETEAFAAETLQEARGRNQEAAYMIVNEAGASVYSASKLAAEEFPQFDVSLRSAVSIARRLQDPLAELVKIEPKAIGVGQYQHDMPKKELERALDGVVEDCVNAVGADVNTASPSLLSRVAGVNAGLAKSIVSYREENGAFASRAALKKVPKLGAKAFEQCAGFLRVPESGSVLDNTGVHPESYAAAKALLEECGCSLKEIRQGHVPDLPAKVEAAGGIAGLAARLGVGEPTLRDIVRELQRPGRDPRDDLPPPMLRTDVLKMEDLAPGMELSGTVRNVIDFGAFIDIGVHQDGLVHISRITNRYIKHPSEILKVGQVVTVWVVSIDLKKQRIALTMLAPVKS